MSVWQNLADEVDAKVTALGSTGALHELVGAESLTSNLFGLMSIQSQLSIITGQNFMGIWENLADEIEAKVTALGSTGSLHELVGAESLTSNLFGLMSIKALLSMINTNSAPSGGGAVAQVKTLNMTTQYAQSIAANTWTAVSGMVLSITPTSASNKILIDIEWRGGSMIADYTRASFALQRNGTLINTSGSSNNQLSSSAAVFYESGAPSIEQMNLNYCDEPNSTSELEYKLVFNEPFATDRVLYTNRFDVPDSYSFISTIRLTEVTT